MYGERERRRWWLVARRWWRRGKERRRQKRILGGLESWKKIITNVADVGKKGVKNGWRWKVIRGEKVWREQKALGRDGGEEGGSRRYER